MRPGRQLTPRLASFQVLRRRLGQAHLGRHIVSRQFAAGQRIQGGDVDVAHSSNITRQ
jgi:hypothetical protein